MERSSFLHKEITSVLRAHAKGLEKSTGWTYRRDYDRCRKQELTESEDDKRSSRIGVCRISGLGEGITFVKRLYGDLYTLVMESS